jgi:archaellum component FlaF (FlaF/FlaG flagellin family)
MGLSTIYANMVMFALVIALLSSIMYAFTDYVGETSAAEREQAARLKARLDTGVQVSVATSTSDNDVRVFAANTGNTGLDADCTDLYLDRQWITRGDMDEYLLLDNTFDPGVWNPGETLKITVTYPADHDVPHEARLTACNGATASTTFWWAG